MKTEIIPAIDIMNGKCVRLTKGDFNTQNNYASSPLEIAKQYEENGINRLHVVDLDGAKKGEVINWETIELLCKKTNLKIDFGGGIRCFEDVARALNIGCSFINIGSISINYPDRLNTWISYFGTEYFILCADVQDNYIYTKGWQEKSEISLESYLEKYLKKGIRQFICTDISRDGTLQGASVDLYRNILKKFPGIELIASGGIGNLNDVKELISIEMPGIIVGKALYEEKINIPELSKLVQPC